MTKRLTVKIDEYQKDGQTKGKYMEVGVLMQGNDGGEYMLLDPCVNLAGVLQKQNALAAKSGKQVRDSIMVSVFDGQQQQQQQQPGGFQQQAPQQQQQQGFQPQQQAPQQPQGTQGYGQGGPVPQQPPQPSIEFDDVPF